MKEGIHPEYNEVKVTCTCGNEFVTRSTKKELRLELCNKCHPFFTGKQRFVDSAGRVERFQKKYGNIKTGKKSASKATKVAPAKTTKKEESKKED